MPKNRCHRKVALFFVSVGLSYAQDMCGGLQYSYTDPATGQRVACKTYFPMPHAQIPVLSEDTGEVRLVQWGRRKGEDEDWDVPVTGWARLISLKEGKWNRYNPKRVKIPATHWMEKDSARVSHWFDLAVSETLLGVRIDRDERSFVYVVTQSSLNTAFADVHERVPLITVRESLPY